MSIALVYKGRLIFEESFGYARIGTGINTKEVIRSLTRVAFRV